MMGAKVRHRVRVRFKRRIRIKEKIRVSVNIRNKVLGDNFSDRSICT